MKTLKAFFREEAFLFVVELCDTLHRIDLFDNATHSHLAQKTQLSCSCFARVSGKNILSLSFLQAAPS